MKKSINKPDQINSGMKIRTPRVFCMHFDSYNIPTLMVYVVASSITDAIDQCYAKYGSDIDIFHVNCMREEVLIAGTYPSESNIRDSEMNDSPTPYDDTDTNTDGVLSLLQ